MKTSEMNRRGVLLFGRNMLLTSLLLGLPAACSISRSDRDEKWQGTLQPVDGKGRATVRKLSGSVTADSRTLAEGDTLSSGAIVTLATASRLVLALPDRSVLQLKEASRLKLDLDSDQGGDLTLHYGSLLSVITSRRRSRYYRIKGAAAQIDVKGTVSFLQTFKPGSDRDADIPGRATDYFCICNGEIDYLNPAGNRREKTLNTDYHKPYFLYPEGNRIGFIETDQLLNHDDREIAELISQMKSPKHDTRWLKTYGHDASY